MLTVIPHVLMRFAQQGPHTNSSISHLANALNEVSVDIPVRVMACRNCVQHAIQNLRYPSPPNKMQVPSHTCLEFILDAMV